MAKLLRGVSRLRSPWLSSHTFVIAFLTISMLHIRQAPLRLRLASFTLSLDAPSWIRFSRLARGRP
ncbi:MAG: hypothetical protein ACSHX6_05045 [Akkermansiaceae bacterium]